MLVYNTKTLQSLDLPARHPVPAGYTPLVPPVPPDDTPVSWYNGGWFVGEVPVPELTTADVVAAAQAKSEAIQAEKVRARDAGFLVDGVLFDSDQSARISYAELALRLASDPTFVTPWKSSAGAWVEMTAAKYAQVAATGGAHIQAVFAWQAARDAEIAALVAGVEAGAKTPKKGLEALALISSTYEAD